MDSFDDLLSSSKHILENPFEDPFAKRSSSPDPWSSFNTATASYQDEDATNAFAAERSTTPTLDSPAFDNSSTTHEHYPAYTQEHHTVADPLDSANQTASEPNTETPSPAVSTSPRTPGFRESISTASVLEETKPEEEPLAQPSPSSPTDHTPASPTPPPTVKPASGHVSRSSTVSLSSTLQAASKPQRAFQTPLDQPVRTASVERSIAALSIGGESIGGWQGAQSTFVGADHSATFSQGRSDSDDDDDDRPILQTARAKLADRAAASTPAPSTGPSTGPPRKDGELQPVFVITVDDPQRVGDPIRAYTMYTVHTKTTSPLFSKSAFSVLRRYSDFLWLYETLSLNNPGVVVPPVPEKHPFGRFDSNFVQQRRLALEKCIQKMAAHPVLQKDPDLKLFLESDTFALDIKHRKAEISNEKGGLMASIGQTIVGPRFYETDEWFDRQKAYLDSLEVQLRGLVKAIDLVAKNRSEMAAATGEFAQSVVELGASEVGKQLASGLAGLADVERTAQDLENTQSQEDTVTIMSTVDEYARLINSVRLAFSSRIRMYNAWQIADANLKRTKQTHETNRAQGRLPSDQLSRSLALVADAERRAMEAKHEFDAVSRLVKAEVARFEMERIEDFKNSLEAFLEGMIARQKQLIGAWEAYQQTLLKRTAPQGQRPAAA